MNMHNIIKKAEQWSLPFVFVVGIVLGIYCYKRTDYRPLGAIVGTSMLSLSAASIVVMSKGRD